MTEVSVHFDYTECQYAIRADLPQTYSKVWNQIASAGNWWSGYDRVAIADEVRNARSCGLCAKRKESLSPFSVEGSHDSKNHLSNEAIDAIHRITTDASRLTKKWLDESLGPKLSIEQYVELLGIVVAVISIDGFHRAMGLPLQSLPAPDAGEPDHYRPLGAVEGDAWVPRIPVQAAIGAEADLYDGNKQTGNVVTAMSLVPDAVRMLKSLSAAQYLKMADVVNPAKNGNRKISRAQMELLAGRVSALNDCFY